MISPILIFLVIAVVGVLMVVFLPSRKVRAAVAGEASCGQCGYSTRGLEVPTCPECGGDLRRVGIVPAGAGKAPLGFVRGIVMFSVVLLVTAGSVNQMVIELLPLRRTYEHRISVTAPSGRKFEIVGTARTWRDTRPPLNVTIHLTTPAQRTMTLDPQGGYRYVDDAGKAVTGTDFGQPVVLAWLQTTGAAPDEPANIEAGEIARLARMATRVRQPQTREGRSQTGMTGDSVGLSIARTERGTAEPPPAARQLAAALWLIPWVLGVMFLWRQRRPQPFTAPPPAG